MRVTKLADTGRLVQAAAAYSAVLQCHLAARDQYGPKCFAVCSARCHPAEFFFTT